MCGISFCEVVTVNLLLDIVGKAQYNEYTKRKQITEAIKTSFYWH